MINNKQFRNEKEYQIHMSVVRSMLKQRLISEKDYKKIEIILLNKYRPIFGTLAKNIS